MKIDITLRIEEKLSSDHNLIVETVENICFDPPVPLNAVMAILKKFLPQPWEGYCRTNLQADLLLSAQMDHFEKYTFIAYDSEICK